MRSYLFNIGYVGRISPCFFFFFYVPPIGILQKGSYGGVYFLLFWSFGVFYSFSFFVFWALVSFLFGFLGQDRFVSIYVPEGYR